MCGISGISIWKPSGLRTDDVASMIADLFRLSERRGKEASGIALRTPKHLSTLRLPMRASRMIRRKDYRDTLTAAFDDVSEQGAVARSFSTIGHARLVTNGRFGIAHNNQPIVSDGVAVVHNGIVLNDDALFARMAGRPRKTDLDTEAVSAFLAQDLSHGATVTDAARALYSMIEGEASIAALFSDRPELLLATNVGGIYYLLADGLLVFASERPMLSDFLKRNASLKPWFPDGHPQRIEAGQALLVDLEGGGPRLFSLLSSDAVEPAARPAGPKILLRDPLAAAEDRRRNLRRCTRCILPETVPGISFDGQGVCSYCQDYTAQAMLGADTLRALADRHRSADGRPDCLIGLSGGRDSSYGLHYVKRELGLNPIAYTYDWALVTDVARRNASRMCATLGVEHVLVSADIQEKRHNIRRNVEAWAARPELGMIPLFMAGDKAYFYYYAEVSKRYGLDLVLTCGNRFEMTDFKSGFAGVRTNIHGTSYRPYDTAIFNKFKLAIYYAKNFIVNPRYLNSSLVDTATGFYFSYFMKHRFHRLFDYITWDESEIDRVLCDEYQWEKAGDTSSTWRIGDGTASFYNYIYFTIAGFTEHDTFRSNQIRAGKIGREEAIAYVERDNMPRFGSMREYADTIGFDFDRVLAAIDLAPRLY